MRFNEILGWMICKEIEKIKRYWLQKIHALKDDYKCDILKNNLKNLRNVKIFPFTTQHTKPTRWTSFEEF